MKQIDIGKLSESEKKETVKEAKILEVLSHPNIVKFIEVYKTKNGKLCIVMDFADGKNNSVTHSFLQAVTYKTGSRSKEGGLFPRLRYSSGSPRFALV